MQGQKQKDRTEVPDPLTVEDLISYKLNNRQKLARLITQYILVQGVTENDSQMSLLLSTLKELLMLVFEKSLASARSVVRHTSV